MRTDSTKSNRTTIRATRALKFRRTARCNSRESGVTMALVAIAMVAIIAMAALSVDVVTLLLAREEAQRSADAGALAAARVMSVSGMTGDTTTTPVTWQCICGTGCPTTSAEGGLGFATLAAQTAAGQSNISGVGGSALTLAVNYSAGGGTATDCTTLGNAGAFGVNPMVTVQVTRNNLPTFFSRIWGNTGNTVSATATAEAYNPSFSVTYSNQGTAGTIIPVQPRCVKPWIVPNQDPLYPRPSAGTPPTYCSPASPNHCNTLVDTGTGAITHPGVSLDGSGTNGVIGETFTLVPDCQAGGFGFGGGRCNLYGPPQANLLAVFRGRGGTRQVSPNPPDLEYVPGQTLNASVAVPSAASAGNLYERAVAGCDQATVYQCGVASANTVELTENPAEPRAGGDTMNGVMALIHQVTVANVGNITTPTGQDYFSPTNATPQFTSTPFQILPGTSNPLISTGFPSSAAISTSNSIVTLPIYDSVANAINGIGTSQVTIVGFLQVFINGVDEYGDVNVTVLNVAGCSNGAGSAVSSNPVTGSSPVPVRLITPPAP
jgi:hypothetical protein